MSYTILTDESVSIDAQHDAALTIGTRKLIRPPRPANASTRRDPLHNNSDPLTHALVHESHHVPESTHAEAFYFQKQVQTQTPMIIVLDDGEELDGVIEWYDRGSIKLRLTNRQRMLVYKSAIKYIYKAGENQPPFPG